MHRERSRGCLTTRTGRDPPPERRRRRCARAVGVACLPTRTPCLAVRRRTTFLRVLLYCFPFPDHHLSNSVRRVLRLVDLDSRAATNSDRAEGGTQDAPPGTRRRWGVWYRSRIRGGWSSYATAYPRSTRLLHRSSSPAAGDSPPRASFPTAPASSARLDPPRRRFESRPGTRSPHARRRARSSSGRGGGGRSLRAARRRVGKW